MPFSITLLLCAVFLLTNCTTGLIEPEFKEEIIVNGYLIVGNGVDTIHVSKSLPIDEDYSYEAAAVSTDSVFISVDDRTFRLLEYDTKPGAYHLQKDSMTITPGKEYCLEVCVEGKTIHASTIAPEQIQIQGLNTDTSYYPYPDPDKSTRFQLSWNETDFTAAYEFSVIATPPYDLVDFGMDQLVENRLEEFDNDTLLAFWPVHDFPVSKFETSVEIPWFAFSYYGDYKIKLYAIDDNLWDLAASSVIYMPQSSEFEQPVYNVDRGLGIFAAVSVDSVHVHVKRQE